MQININTEELSSRQATALMMMLMSLYPQEVGVPALRAAAPTAAPVASIITPQDAPDAGTETAAAVFAMSAAAIFGVIPAPLATPNGAPPAPLNITPTAPLPLSAAAAVFAVPSATIAPPPPGVSVDAGYTPPAPSGMLDADGLPWDGRIHASTRTCTAKGVWKKRKGVEDDETSRVVAELRGVQAANKAAAHVPLNAAPPPPSAAAAVFAVPSATIAPPPPAASTAPVSFVDVAKYVGARQFTAEQILGICKKHGLPGLGLLTGAPALCAPMMADFQAM